jgi:bacteriocin-like protein
MEMIMSKTNDTSRDELTIKELDAVSGGMLSFGRAATATQSNDALTQVLQQLLQSIQSQSKTGTTG